MSGRQPTHCTRDEDGDFSTYNPAAPLGKAGEKQFYSDRNYDLFSILANVRNGYGFAGVETGEGFVPISQPKGVPEDACPEYLAVVAQWDGDGHNHSWLTVRELLEYDWTQTTRKTGFVTISEWAEWRDHGSPRSWSGGVMGGSVVHVSSEDMERAWQTVREEYNHPEQRWASVHLCRSGPELERMIELLGNAYCRVGWEVSYYEQCGPFLSETMPRLWRLGPPDRVRCCFFFDN
jgi:hypothetical protein